jgi:hypothetical protein
MSKSKCAGFLSLHPATWAVLLVQCCIVGYLNATTAGWPWHVRSATALQLDLLIGLGAVLGGAYLTERFFRTSHLQLSIKAILVITGSVATALAFLQYYPHYRTRSLGQEVWLAWARFELICLAGVLLWLCDIGTTWRLAFKPAMNVAVLMLIAELLAVGFLTYQGYSYQGYKGAWGWPELWVGTKTVDGVTTREVLGWNVAYDLLIALLAVFGGTRLVHTWSSLTGARFDGRMVFVCSATCLMASLVMISSHWALEIDVELTRLCAGLVWLGVVGSILTLIDLLGWMCTKS